MSDWGGSGGFVKKNPPHPLTADRPQRFNTEHYLHTKIKQDTPQKLHIPVPTHTHQIDLQYYPLYVRDSPV